MRASITAYAKGLENPLVANPGFGANTGAVSTKQMMRRMRDALADIFVGRGLQQRVEQRPIIYYSTQTATAAITLASVLAADTVTLNGVTLTAVSGAPANNQFDISGADAVDATSLVSCILNSTSALVSGQLVANNYAGVVTCASVAAGDTVTLSNVVLTAINTATDSGGLRITTMPPNVWAMNGNDTADGDSLVNCINAHPRLRELYFASNAAGVVTIRERYPSPGAESTLFSSNGTRLAISVADATTGRFAATATVLIEALHSGAAGNMATIASSNGTRLAIAGSASRLAGGVTSSVTY